METQFDELARGLALGLSRRETLRRLGGFLGGCAVASLGLPGRGWAQLSPGCRQLCRTNYPGRSEKALKDRRHCESVCERQCGGEASTCMVPAPSDGSPVTRCKCADGSCPELGSVCCGSSPCPQFQCCRDSELCCPDGQICCFGSCCPTERCCPFICCPEGTICRRDPNDETKGTCEPCASGATSEEPDRSLADKAATCEPCDPPCGTGEICCPDGQCHTGGQCCPCFDPQNPDAGLPAGYYGAPAGYTCCRQPCTGGGGFYCPPGLRCCTYYEPWVGPPEQNMGARCIPPQCY